MKTKLRQYLTSNYGCIAENIDTLLNKQVEKEISDIEVVMNLTESNKTIVWKEKGKLTYEFLADDEIRYLIQTLLEDDKKYNLILRLQNDQWIREFNPYINELLSLKCHKEVREIVKMIEIN